MNNRKCIALGTAIITALSSLLLTGCGSNDKYEGKTVITMVQYKPEAVEAFDEMAERFNESHDEIHLEIESPNDAMTVLKTRFIRNDYPDIIGIGGDINYSNFLDAGMFMDVSDFDGVSDIKQAYMDIVDELEFIPVGQEELVLITPKDHPLAQKEEIDLLDTVEYDYVYFTKNSGLRPVIDSCFSRIKRQPTIAYEGEEDSSVAGLVAAGFGIAIKIGDK